MPKEIRDSEQFQKLISKAQELRVVRFADFVKLKIRTPDYLYTYKTNRDEADDILKGVKDIEVIEFTKAVEEKKADVGKEEPITPETKAPVKKKKSK